MTISGSPWLFPGAIFPAQPAVCAYSITQIGLSAEILVGFIKVTGVDVKPAG